MLLSQNPSWVNFCIRYKIHVKVFLSFSYEVSIALRPFVEDGSALSIKWSLHLFQYLWGMFSESVLGSSLYYSTYVCVYPSVNMIWCRFYSYTLALKFNTLILLTPFFFSLFQLFYFYWLFIHFFRIISCLSAKEVCFELDGNSAKPMCPCGKTELHNIGSSKARA